MTDQNEERPGEQTGAFPKVQAAARTEAIVAKPADSGSVQFVIEFSVADLHPSRVWMAIDRAISGAPIGTLVRMNVGTAYPPLWISHYLAAGFQWQVTAADAVTLRAWADALTRGERRAAA